MGLKVDIDRISALNATKKGFRKYGFLVNTGDKLTKVQR